MTSEKQGFIVAEVKVIKTIKFGSVDSTRPIKRGSIVTISLLDHPTDVKLWYNGAWQISPEHFDIKYPVRIVRAI